jgi:uncharacterized repeat protein (TIGR03803 family)
LIAVGRDLYDTTFYGGLDSSYNAGTVYKLTPSGSGYKESVVYSFIGGCATGHCRDGLWPEGGLVYANNTLYGTTFGSGLGDCIFEGSSSSANIPGCGTIFALTPKP